MVDWNGTLYFYMGTRGNLRSVPSATWVDMPTFMLIASISCQHPHIIHRSYSSLHVWWSAFLPRWFVEWRCGQVPRIRLCLWWVEMSKLILCFWVVLAYTYLIATLLFFLSFLVHDGGLERDSLLLYGNSGGNLWSVPSATWVDTPTFMLIASISCQHPHIIYRSYSSLHVWWSAFLTRWFVEWRCGQVPRIRLYLVRGMSKLILCFWVVLAYTYLIATLLFFLSFLVHDGGLELDSLLFDWNYGGNLWSVPSATWVDTPTFMLIASISCQHPHIIHHSYSSLHVWWSVFFTRWFVEWRCGQVPRIRLCLWWVEMSKVILCF